MTFHLSIATPEIVSFDDEVFSVTIPGQAGYMEILKDHAQLITSLRAGTVTVVTKSREKLTYKISGGFFEVSLNRATLLVDIL